MDGPAVHGDSASCAIHLSDLLDVPRLPRNRVSLVRSVSPPPADLSSSVRCRSWDRLIRGFRLGVGSAPCAWITAVGDHATPSLFHRFRFATLRAGERLSVTMQSPRAVLIHALLRVIRGRPSPAVAAVAVGRSTHDDVSAMISHRSSAKVRRLISSSLSPSFPSVPLPDRVASPMSIAYDAWARRLVEHGGWYRDPQSLLSQLRDGVRLGYIGSREGYLFRPNHPSSMSSPESMAVIDKEIMDELALKRMAGPFTVDEVKSMFPFIRTSPMAAVPKSDGGWRIIDDLTAGDDESPSVNAHIPDEAAKVNYMHFDSAVQRIRSLGRGCWLAKVDWKAAFRQIVVHKDDWPLLGLQWRNRVFVRLVLPFGARSSPRLFTQFAQAFAGILKRNGAQHVMFYLDDFLLLAPSREACDAAVRAMEALAAELGVTLHPTKRDGPANVLAFLGIGIDTIAMRIFLPLTKKAKVRAACDRLLQAGRASLHELRSVVGLMLHAAQVVQPGRLMARRVLEFKRPFECSIPHNSRLHLPITLPDDVCDDLRWWVDCLDHWDGISMIPAHGDWAEPIVIQTDAASTDGAGAVLLELDSPSSDSSISAWLYHPWSANGPWRRWTAASLEMAAIAISLNTFGGRLAGRRIRINSDSSNSVDALKRTATSSPLHMRLLRGIHAIAMHHDFHIQLVSHIKGTHNVCADAASRLSMQTAQRMHQLGLLESRRLIPSIPDWLISLMMQESSSALASAAAPAPS